MSFWRVLWTSATSLKPASGSPVAASYSHFNVINVSTAAAVLCFTS
jgi:hypothetical protein